LGLASSLKIIEDIVTGRNRRSIPTHASLSMLLEEPREICQANNFW
jgi:hypothetical protein